MKLVSLLAPKPKPTTAVEPRTAFANSTADIQAEVVRCADDGERLRPMGGARGDTPLTTTDENRLSLAHMRGADIAHLERHRLWARAGTPLADVSAWLARHELTLDVRPDYPGQTVGGAISLGSPGALTSRILSLRVVHADGGVAVYTRDDSPQTFDQMRIALGALGVITHVELQCLPLSSERLFSRRNIDIDELRELLRTPRAVSGLNAVTWFAQAPAVVECLRAAGSIEPPSLLDQAHAALMEGIGTAALVRYAPRLPGGKRLSDRIGARYARSAVRGVLPARMVLSATHITYALPAQAAGEVLDRVRALWAALRFRSYAPLQLEFAPPDRAWLSPGQGREAVLLSFPYARGTPIVMLEALCLLLERHGGRPAWSGLPPHELPNAQPNRRHYPHLADFAALRAEFDPHGVFLSPYLARLLHLHNR